MGSAAKFHLAILSPSERPSFEMSEWFSRIAQNCVGSVPVPYSARPGTGNQRTPNLLTQSTHKSKATY